MDPYLAHPALWPDVHNRLIAALGRTIPTVFKTPEILRMDCDLPLDAGLGSRRRSSLHAVTNEHKEFALDNVLVGEYALRLRQESSGAETKDVTVRGGDYHRDGGNE
jgi:Protein of unknown function (DUF4058)